MIISINATVCGDMTMVSNEWFMIVGSDVGKGDKEARKAAVTRGNGILNWVCEVMVRAGSCGRAKPFRLRSLAVSGGAGSGIRSASLRWRRQGWLAVRLAAVRGGAA